MRDMFYLSSSFFLKGQILYTSIKYLSSSIFSLEGQIRYIGVTYLPLSISYQKYTNHPTARKTYKYKNVFSDLTGKF
jgi:hypothetical protein